MSLKEITKAATILAFAFISNLYIPILEVKSIFVVVLISIILGILFGLFVRWNFDEKNILNA